MSNILNLTFKELGNTDLTESEFAECKKYIDKIIDDFDKSLPFYKVFNENDVVYEGNHSA